MTPEKFNEDIGDPDPDGQLVAQCDSPPQGGARPTSTWQPGEVVPDECEVLLPDIVPEGPYEVYVGMYAWPDLERLPAFTYDGMEAADGRLFLTAFEWREPSLPMGGMVMAWAAALAVVALGISGIRRDREADVEDQAQVR